MSDPDQKTRDASCACGRLTVSVIGEPEIVSVCNCTACQRRTGSVFGTSAYFDKTQLVSVIGDIKTFQRGSDSGRTLSMHFCPECGSTVYWELAMYPDLAGVAVGCFADPDFTPPQRAVWTDKQHHWVQFPDEMNTFPKAP